VLKIFIPRVRRCRLRRTSSTSFWACIGGYKAKPLGLHLPRGCRRLVVRDAMA